MNMTPGKNVHGHTISSKDKNGRKVLFAQIKTGKRIVCNDDIRKAKG